MRIEPFPATRNSNIKAANVKETAFLQNRNHIPSKNGKKAPFPPVM